MTDGAKPNICSVCGWDTKPFFQIVTEEPGKEDDHRTVCRECLAFLTNLRKREAV